MFEGHCLCKSGRGIDMSSTNNKHIIIIFTGMTFGALLCISILLSVNFDQGLGIEDKTLWDWVDLFLLPIVIALSVGFFHWNSRYRQKQQAKVGQQIALDHQREELMNAYFEFITSLYLEDGFEMNGEIQDAD
jgi:hypothetical protein